MGLPFGAAGKIGAMVFPVCAGCAGLGVPAGEEYTCKFDGDEDMTSPERRFKKRRIK